MNATRAARSLLPALAAASLACQPPAADRDLPSRQLYFPSGMFFAQPDPVTAPRSGALFVASSNFDRRYDKGRLTGIDVSALSCSVAPAGACLPDFPAPAATYPDGNDFTLETLADTAIDEKHLASLAGELDGIQGPGGGFRLLVPSRAEGSPLQVMDAAGHRITCRGEGAADDCSVGAISLEANRATASGVPRAPAPYSISISKPDGDAFITSLQPADSPAATGQNLAVFTVKLNAFDPQVTDDHFISLGLSRTQSVAMGRRYAFMTGVQTTALRLIDRLNDRRILNAAIEINFNLLDTRGVALAGDESEVFVAARNPDALLVMHVSGPTTDTPSLSLSHAELLPLGASQVRVLDKPSGGHVAIVTSVGTQSFDAVGQTQGSLVIYDDEAAQQVATLDGFGLQPYGLALQPIPPGVRLYVGLFGEGRVAVVDIPDLDRPEDARLVGRLGTTTVCVTNPSSRGCAALNP